MARLKNTYTNAFKRKCYDHLINGAYDVESKDERTVALSIFKSFNSAANYPANVKRLPSIQMRVADWLSGLPLNIAAYNGEIIDKIEEWHEVTLTDKQIESQLENWFNFMAFNLLHLWEKHGVDYHNTTK